MTSRQQAKGDRAARELVEQLRALGYSAHQIRKEGVNDQGDVGGVHNVTIQAKNYADVARAYREALEGALEQQKNADTQWGAGMVRRRGGRWVVVMELDQWAHMHREAARL